MRYAVVIENAGGNISTYVPDLAGCIATGPAVPAAKAEFAGAMRCLFQGALADGLPAPVLSTVTQSVEA